ncbi:zinc ribbon domain-containing protein [Microcoleus sp. AR_TQ3_B6]|uniref:zinc ribbon domain-containing protein n=1 Tax=Microcoleus sp. AR_TQ3_B6 TaxID=3055284 RepID=UPI002FD21F82
MVGSKKQQKTEEVYTPVIPVVSCADETQVDRIAELCRISRALTYNKLGSVKRWGLDGQKANPIVRTILKATDINLQSKLWEWSISYTMKAIAAQQEAAKVGVVRGMGRTYPLSPVEKERTNSWLKTAKSTKNNDSLLKFPKAETEILRDNLFDLLHNDTSYGDEIAAALSKLMTAKSKRSVSTDRNKYRQRSYIKDLDDPIKVKNIWGNNLAHKVKSRKIQRERATLQNFICRDLKKLITSPTRIFAEDLTQPISGKHQSKAINRQLNQWMKSRLQASWEKISRETGSNLSVVNPAYTSQMCSQTGTLLGKRDGDVFTAYTEVVIQSDKKAALNILYCRSDSEINRWMKYAEVGKVLLLPTVRYLTSIGKSVTEVWDLGWINPKFKVEAIGWEDEYHRQG